MSQSIGMISLGCAKNQVNAEQMLFLLRVAGYEILPDPDGADLVIINTCGFIEDAKAEAIDNILAMGELKKEGRIGKILVTGCLAQRYQMEIVQEMPEVDGVLGTGSYYDIVSAVGKVLAGELVSEFGDINAPQPEPQRILTTPEHYAYLRIAEGCDNHCAFCIIPQLRGRYRSRPMEELLKEAQDLADSGVKELIVIAQDTSRYGIDLYGERKLAELLQKLCAIDGFVWVRVHYLYPDEMSEELIDVLANEPKIVKYLDIPIQHINDNILRAMNRGYTAEKYLAQVDLARKYIPNLVLTTDVIVGFPGETEEDFLDTLALTEKVRFDSMFTFIYSRRPGTPAAKIEDDTPRSVIQNRFDRLVESAGRVSAELHRAQEGKAFRVLIDGTAKNGDYTLSARTAGGRLVHLRGDESLIGSWANARIVSSNTFALFGEITE